MPLLHTPRQIIDPYADMEIQYATPCFAFAAAALVVRGYYTNATQAAATLAAAELAVDAALTALVFGQVGAHVDCSCVQCVPVVSHEG